MKPKTIYFAIYFYVGWFGAVGLALSGYGEMALLFPLALSLYMLKCGIVDQILLFKITFISVLGFLFDLLIQSLGWVLILDAGLFPLPLWLLSIWILFCLAFLPLTKNSRLPFWVWAILGGVGGPLSYRSGQAFGLLQFPESRALWVYGIFWAVLSPLLVFMYRKNLPKH